jgi:2-polyprenyl-3-methyl-5-hydroxy-6-metoxy-1,4-benzoquinol methylase
MQVEGYYSNPRLDVLALLKRVRTDNILEIGGGDFPTLIEARSRLGGEIWGIDVRASDTKLDRMIVGSVTDEAVRAQLADKKFDLIIANDVIEHIEDTEAFFAVLKQHLRDDGDLLLSVPNIRNVKLLYHIFLRGTFPRHDAGLFDKTHLRWFCRKDIETLSVKAGLKVVDHSYGGRFVSGRLTHFRWMEFVSLHNLFRLTHQ